MDVEERGDVLQVEQINDAGTALHQQVVALAGRGAVEVEIARTELAEDVLGNDGTLLHRLLALVEELLQLLARDPDDAAGHHRLDGGLRRTTVEERGVIDHELALEREPRDVFPVVTEAVRHVLEASLGDKGQPPRQVALALQLVAPAVHDRLALPLAEFPQRLEVNTLIVESLFHLSLCIVSNERTALVSVGLSAQILMWELFIPH